MTARADQPRVRLRGLCGQQSQGGFEVLAVQPAALYVGADSLHGPGLLLVDGGHPGPAGGDLGQGQSSNALADDPAQPGTKLPPEVIGVAASVGACQH